MGQAIRTSGYAPSFAAAGTGLLLLAMWTQYQYGRLNAATKPA
jgi:hypothetical protein